ncbi:hypothetical protein BT96DRAFT_1001193 [Gymnopus androsaceus JB14]|uniref:Uncharacterized protein n=1 Tax=Gymnopus androsaceus JB14 TaxID=1447944 RepID=A0A6A4H2I1_9AGAR|nr:hypothetical protein BT96DRAFT_1001193 [Gymnopus androsaceus JB14]
MDITIQSPGIKPELFSTSIHISSYMSSEFPSPGTICPQGVVCFDEISYFELPLSLSEQLVIPVAVELFLYGIFLVLFIFSLYVFRKKFMPGPLYVTATLLFFTMATISLSLDLAWRSSSINTLEVTGLYPVGSPEVNTFPSTKSEDLRSGPYYLFIIADAMMIHRCYRLWNSRKGVIILPVFGLIATIILEVLFFSAASIEFTYMIYGPITLLENLVLTGLMAGRVWWLNHQFKRVSGKTSQNVLQSLLVPVLQSGALNTAFLSTWTITTFVTGSFQFLTPCALTQVVGISSTLIVVSVGIGLNPPTTIPDQENQSGLILESTLESRKSTGSGKFI